MGGRQQVFSHYECNSLKLTLISLALLRDYIYRDNNVEMLPFVS